MISNIKHHLSDITAKYKKNPAWGWLLLTVFSFFLLPEYISPFILFAAFIVFKRQWTREGRLAKVGNIGKIELTFMTYMLISAIWSKTTLDTLGAAGLWWAVILIQVMIFNLARTKEKIKKVITVLVASAAINGGVGAVQLITFVLAANGKIPQSLILTTPFYRNLDIKVYTLMPFSISTDMWKQRASGFFSNPNLLATFMVVAFPLAVYLLLTARSKKGTVLSYLSLVCISAGMASTMTRAGCYLMLGMWVVLFGVFIKRNALKMLAVFLPMGGTIIPSILIRYGKMVIYSGDYIPIDGLEAIQSSQAHFDIWKSMIDYIIHHISVFLFGTGFGMERTGTILYNLYDLKKPHSHNFVIEIWAELGIVGIIMLALIIFYAVGKILEIKTENRETLTLTICVISSFVFYLVFGLSDYIFNSPKQIIFFMILIGLVQAISYTYDKNEIHSVKDAGKAIGKDIQNLIRQ